MQHGLRYSNREVRSFAVVPFLIANNQHSDFINECLPYSLFVDPPFFGNLFYGVVRLVRVASVN
jgi:hypothetical protein